MTVKDFKIKYPHFSHFEGESLYERMEICKLQEQREEALSRRTFFEKYQLRWMFYRSRKHIMYGKTNNYSAEDMCKSCKRGVNSYIARAYIDEKGSWINATKCPHCGILLDKVPNINLNRKLYKLGERVKNNFWKALDYLHICRNQAGGRYPICFSDESAYIISTQILKTGEFKHFFRNRKWWEYIFIEKS